MPSIPPISGGGEHQTGGTVVFSVQERLLGHRLYTQALARYLAAGLLIAGAVAAHAAIGVTRLDVGAITLVAVAMAVYNTCVMAVIVPLRTEPEAERRLPRLRAVAHASIVLDFLALTVALWFVGGARSPFLAFYLLHIGIASVLLSRRAAYFAAILAAVLLLGLVLAEVTGLLPPPRPEGAVQGDGPMDMRYVATIVVVYLSLFGLIVLAQTQLAQALRRGEHAAQDRAEQFEKLSRMRRDFLHVALHDVSSPIAAAEQLLRNLREGLCGPLEPRQREQVDRALAKLEGMEHLVRDVRLLSEVESTDLKAHSTEIPLAFLLGSVVAENEDVAREKGLALTMEPCERAAIVFGVPRLLREAIANYVTNAIKYTLPGGSITTRVRPSGDAFRVEVSDTGVGIAAKDQSRLFEEFARVARGHPALKGVPGTGLGLSIARRIAEAHGGSVGFVTAPGEGSTFWLELPACTGTEDAPTDAGPAPEARGADDLGADRIR